MSSDWIHCNSCLSTPSQNIQLAFSSCGHIVCKKCISKIPNAASCPYCKKNSKFMEINRTLKPEMQMYFRNPRDLANEYMKNLSSVLDFQNGHRSRFARAQTEKTSKMMKFATAAQGEIKKRIDSEKRALSDCKEFRSENEKLKMHNEQLEALLVARDMEIDRLRNSGSYSSPTARARNEYHRADSGLGDTPMSSLSFIDAITSTPINRGESPTHGYGARKKSRDRLQQMFQSANGSIPSPIVRPEMATPAMLGFNKKRSTSETNRRTPNGTNFMFDDNMDLGGY